MIKLNQYPGSMIPPVEDAILYESFTSGQAGIIEGCEVTSLGSNQLRVSAGHGVILGRSFAVEEETILAELSQAGSVRGRLSIKIDLGNTQTPISFVSVAAGVLPEPVQEELNGGGSVFEMPLAEYDVDELQISNVTMAAENVYMASPWGETTATASTGEGAVSITSKLKGMKEISFISPKEYSSKDTYTLNGQQIELKDIKGGALSDAAWAANVPVQLMVNAGIGYLMGGAGGGAGPTVGTYTGDGETTRTISIGYKPKNIFVFGASSTELVTGGQIANVRMAVVVTDNDGNARYSDGIALTEDGFMVVNMANGITPPSASRPQLNLSGKVYAYITW